ADHQHVKLGTKRAGDFETDRHAAARQRKNERPSGSEMFETPRQQLPGLRPIGQRQPGRHDNTRPDTR
ncbi:MAG: hypothetical protein CFE45_36965, partial [Burkholderiales bacterium PBB5]